MNKLASIIKNHWLFALLTYTVVVITITHAVLNTLVINPLITNGPNSSKNIETINSKEFALFQNQALSIAGNKILVSYKYNKTCNKFALYVTNTSNVKKFYCVNIGDRILIQDKNNSYSIDILRQRGNILDIAWAAINI